MKSTPNRQYVAPWRIRNLCVVVSGSFVAGPIAYARRPATTRRDGGGVTVTRRHRALQGACASTHVR